MQHEALPPLPSSWASALLIARTDEPEASTPMRALIAARLLSSQNAGAHLITPTARTPVHARVLLSNPQTPPATVSKNELRARLAAVTVELEVAKKEVASLRADRDDATTPVHLRCPITLQRMVSPVICSDGHSFERTAINSWLAERRTNPLTGATLQDASLVPALALRDAIAEWEVAHGREPTERAEEAEEEPPAEVQQEQPRAAPRPSSFLSRAMANAGMWLSNSAQSLAEAEQARADAAAEREAARLAAEEQREVAQRIQLILRARAQQELVRRAEAARRAERAEEEMAWELRRTEMLASHANVARVRRGFEHLSPAAAVAWELQVTTERINESREAEGLPPATPETAAVWEHEQGRLRTVAWSTDD
jgi:hypothetical protein